jgi:hypothetical protein
MKALNQGGDSNLHVYYWGSKAYQYQPGAKHESQTEKLDERKDVELFPT